MANSGLIKGEYPQPCGRKLQAVANIAGPASYTQVTTGTPPTGGQQITADQIKTLFGFNYVDYIDVSASTDGQYDVTVIYPDSNTGVNTIRLLWTTAATGAQVAGGTNLSGVSIRAMAIGS